MGDPQIDIDRINWIPHHETQTTLQGSKSKSKSSIKSSSSTIADSKSKTSTKSSVSL